MAIGRARSDPGSHDVVGAAGTPFERPAGAAAIAAAVTALIYAVAFVALRTSTIGPALTSLGLLVGGVLSAIALVAVYERVRSMEPSFALLGLLFGFAGTLGAALHGGFDLANVLHVLARSPVICRARSTPAACSPSSRPASACCP